MIIQWQNTPAECYVKSSCFYAIPLELLWLCKKIRTSAGRCMMKWKTRPAVFNAKIFVCILIQKRLVIKLSLSIKWCITLYVCLSLSLCGSWFQLYYTSRLEKESTVPDSRGQKMGRKGKSRNGKAVDTSGCGQAVDRRLWLLLPTQHEVQMESNVKLQI